MKREYPTGKSDLMTAFMVRAQEFTVLGGSWAMINLPSWMSLKSFEALRSDLLENQRIASMVHLGRGVFGSDFGTVAFVVDNVPPGKTRGIYRRLFEQHVEVRAVTAIEKLFLDPTYNRFEVSQADLTAIPGSPIVYWLSEKMRAAFKVGSPLGEVAELLVGLRTGDNSRFMRQWWEVSRDRSMFDCDSLPRADSSGRRWFPYNKGGAFRRWYGNQEHVINWEEDGREIEEGLAERYPYMVPKGKKLVRAQGRDRYFSPSLSWSDISSGEAAFRRYQQGFIYDSTGHSGFGDLRLLDRLTLLLNSKFVMEVMKVVAPTLHFHIGYVGLVPVSDAIFDLPTTNLSHLVETSREDWDTAETSWEFRSSPLIELSALD